MEGEGEGSQGRWVRAPDGGEDMGDTRQKKERVKVGGRAGMKREGSH